MTIEKAGYGDFCGCAIQVVNYVLNGMNLHTQCNEI